MSFYYFLIGGFFILMGLAVHVFRWHFLIAGYNTMSREKKKNVDTEGLGRFMGIYSYANGVIFFGMGLLQALNVEVSITPALGFFAVSTSYFLIRAQKFDGNLYDEKGKLRQGAGKQMAIPLGILGVTIIAVAALMFASAQTTRVSFLVEGLQIHGMYGEVIEWDSLDEVRLIESLPSIERRTNGSAIGSSLKGHFRTTEYGAVKLFVDTKIPPFVFLRMDERIVIFNMGEARETQEIYGKIVSHTEL